MNKNQKKTWSRVSTWSKIQMYTDNIIYLPDEQLLDDLPCTPWVYKSVTSNTRKWWCNSSLALIDTILIAIGQWWFASYLQPGYVYITGQQICNRRQCHCCLLLDRKWRYVRHGQLERVSHTPISSISELARDARTVARCCAPQGIPPCIAAWIPATWTSLRRRPQRRLWSWRRWWSTNCRLQNLLHFLNLKTCLVFLLHCEERLKFSNFNLHDCNWSALFTIVNGFIRNKNSKFSTLTMIKYK